MTVAIVTACYGGFDHVRPQAEQDIDVEWLCFTDDPGLPAPAPWKLMLARAEYEHPCMAAKVHKLRPRVAQRDVVWIDANMEVTNPCFARESLDSRHDGMATWRHPRRDCIYAEAEASVGAESRGGKYAGLPVIEQVEHYRSEGHPEHAGLYACGTIAWDLADPKVVALGAAWMSECDRWTYQDQLSLPVVTRRLGVEPGTFPLPQIAHWEAEWVENPWLRIHPHVGGW